MHDRLYETDAGNDILAGESVYVPLAAARLLAQDISATSTMTRQDVLLARWPGNTRLLVRKLGFSGTAWPDNPARSRAIIDALSRGPTA